MPSPLTSDVLRYGAVELARRIATREFSSRDVCETLIARIEAVNPTLNAVVWPMFNEARALADIADAKILAGEPLGPLHGVPLTLKENMWVAGTPATLGLTARKHDRSPRDGILVERLRRAGAVFLGKTNVPQLMIWHECDNPLYGCTKNPWDLARTSGGSTGGEAAIIAASGSPLGIGGDMGGSIRMPCHSCGIHGIKPTSYRLTRRGVLSNLVGLDAIQFQPGPMARQVEDLELALRVMVEGAPEETLRPDVFDAPLGTSSSVAIEKLKIAYWEEDGFFPASPAIRRAVREAVAALRDRGAKVIEFSPPDIDEALRLYFGICSADGGADAERILAGSEVDWRVGRLRTLATMWRPFRFLLTKYLRVCGQNYFARLLEDSGGRSAEEFWRLAAAQTEYVARFFSELDAAGCDAILCPPHALPAMPHRAAIDLLAAASYCYLPNLLGAPAGVVSITRVRAGEESDRPSSRDPVITKAQRSEEGSVGLPIGVQVVAKHWREDIVLAVMKAIEADFCERSDYPIRAMPLSIPTTS